VLSSGGGAEIGMRSGAARLVWFAAALLVGVSWAATARSASLPFTATLQIEFNGIPFAPITGAGTAVVNGSGGGLHVSSLDLASGLVSTVGLVAPITDPAAYPIRGLQLTAANGAGAFAETAMGTLTGVMPLLGVAKVCLFEPCASAIGNLSVPLSVAGSGGTAYVDAAVQITVVGAPWTTGTAVIDTIFVDETRMGSRMGPASAASSTGQASGAIHLVAPMMVRTNVNTTPFGAFAHLTLHFVPEPVTLTSLGLGIAALAIAARRRR
jgi:hypothetical protein